MEGDDDILELFFRWQGESHLPYLLILQYVLIVYPVSIFKFNVPSFGLESINCVPHCMTKLATNSFGSSSVGAKAVH